MKGARLIHPSDVRLYYFGSRDVLSDTEARESRRGKLQRAMVLTNCERIPIVLCIQLPNGEVLQTESDLVDYADDFVILKGGFHLPVSAIIDVDV